MRSLISGGDLMRSLILGGEVPHFRSLVCDFVVNPPTSLIRTCIFFAGPQGGQITGNSPYNNIGILSFHGGLIEYRGGHISGVGVCM